MAGDDIAGFAMSLYAVKGIQPTLLGSQHFIAPNVAIIGNVTLHDQVSVWFGAVIRAENDAIIIGARTNIQDGCVLHVDPLYPLCIGEDVTVGHKVVLHGCTIGNGSLIGINAVILNGAKIGNGCLIGANTLVTENMVIPDYSLVLGSPAKIKRSLTSDEQIALKNGALNYVNNAKLFNETLQLVNGRNHE